MGQSKSKALKYPQYPLPPGYPPYGPVYPYGVPPLPAGYAPAPGYHAPVIPTGYGPLVAMPQPLLNLQPQQRPRKKKKKENKSSTGYVPPAQHDQPRSAPANVQPAPPGMLENLPPGFVPTNIAPNPPGVSSTNLAQGAPPPSVLFTPGVPGEAPITNFPSSEHPQRRAATPFLSAFPPIEPSDDEEGDGGGGGSSEQDNYQHGVSQHHHSLSHRRGGLSSQYQPPAFEIVRPEDPIASPGITPNPLPQPPRDLYALSPYKQLLHLPTTTALLSATTTTTTANPTAGFPNPNVTVVRSGTNPGIAGIGAGNPPQQQIPILRKSKRGLFSFGSRRRTREPTPEPPTQQQQQQQHTLGNIHFVPIYRDGPPPGNTTITATGPSMGEGVVRPQGGGTPVPPIPTPPSFRAQRSPPQNSPPRDDNIIDTDSDDDEDFPQQIDPRRAASPMSHQSHYTSRSYQPQSRPSLSNRPVYPTNPTPQPQGGYPQHHQHQQQQQQSSIGQPYHISANGSVIEFSQDGLPDFLNHSPHSVIYDNKRYPTAMHLHEAMKFMDHKPELAESIRNCASPEEIYPLTAGLQAWVRPDWGRVFLDKMEEVLWYKFRQHNDLRTMLLKTGRAHLVYSDQEDAYWGSGAPFDQAGDYRGSNLLGKLLEKVRDRLRQEGWN